MPKTKYTYSRSWIFTIQDISTKFQVSFILTFIFQACETGFSRQAANTPNKSSPEMDTAQVTLLTCYYVQQYYQPNHQESIGEKEKCEAKELMSWFACKRLSCWLVGWAVSCTAMIPWFAFATLFFARWSPWAAFSLPARWGGEWRETVPLVGWKKNLKKKGGSFIPYYKLV